MREVNSGNLNAKLTYSQVENLRQIAKKAYLTEGRLSSQKVKELAKQVNVSTTTINSAIQGKTYKETMTIPFERWPKKCVRCGKVSKKTRLIRLGAISCIECELEYARELEYAPHNKGSYGPNWIEQRNKVRERDMDTCQHCGRKRTRGESHFAVHHIIPLRKFRGDYLAGNSLTNLIMLCPPCHTAADLGRIAKETLLLKTRERNMIDAKCIKIRPVTDAREVRGRILRAYADVELTSADGLPLLLLSGLQIIERPSLGLKPWVPMVYKGELSLKMLNEGVKERIKKAVLEAYSDQK